ncbi:MAG: uracil-DNA glycosylase family protein, partial [Bacteroidaceae bacterium]|nr:uracil-DNA glycosylase family protein [Bacteroidaceae bacterium]
MEDYLNTENIARSGEVEWHPLKPCINEETRVLFLGSFPPQRKKWAKGFNFFYPNFINDHWRIMGLIFYGDKDHFVDTKARTYKGADIIRFVHEHGLGYYDTSEAVKRLKDNASDKFLEVTVPTDIRTLISRAPRLQKIVVTGQKAADTLCDYFHIDQLPKMGESTDIPYL